VCVSSQVPIMYDEIDLPTSAAQLSLMQKLTQVWARTVTQFIFLSTKYRIKFFLDKVRLPQDRSHHAVFPSCNAH
jgi:hypothetical protein